ncbi:unnamed protein product [Mortierella alpina]
MQTPKTSSSPPATATAPSTPTARFGRARQFGSLSSSHSALSLKENATLALPPVLYQDILPTELWRLILNYLPTLDLFSLYSTSTYMRALSAPLLVQTIANKSVCLYLYQEYVRRVGIKFVFNHFDLARDRVVFRPEVADNQYRFRSGLTLQNPQLEEIAVTTFGRAIKPHQVQQSDGRYFTVQRTVRACKQALSKSQPIPVPSASSSAASSSAASTSPASAATDSPGIATAASATVVEDSRKRTTDEKVYHGAKNFLDKTCPVHVRRSGIRQVDGTRHSFLQDYPWTLHYQVDNEQLLSTNDSTVDRSSIAGSNRNPFFFNVRQYVYHSPLQVTGQDAGASEADHEAVRSSSHSGAPISPTEHSPESAEYGAFSSPVTQAVASKHSSTPGSGPRYLRFLMFECSMKFLDPKRATRNIIGRWIEGKVQRWKKVLGGMRHTTANGTQQHSAMADSMQDKDEFGRTFLKGPPHCHGSSELMESLDWTDRNHDPEELLNLPGSSSTGHPIEQEMRSLGASEFRPSTVTAF